MTHHPPAHRLAPLLAPRSIAVIGASPDPGGIGGAALRCLTDWGFPGPLYPVTPDHDAIAGRPCIPDVAALPEPVDLAIIAASAETTLAELRHLAARGARAAIAYATGFEETNDAAGRRRGAELAALARTHGMAIGGPNCMGGANYVDRVYTAFVPAFAALRPPGPVALVTQSGNMCAALYRLADAAGIGFSHVINTGNETCTEFAEYLEYLADDPTTEAVLGYVETLRDGPRFLRVARAFRDRGKLLALFKAGGTVSGAAAARSHTAALAGDGRAYEAAFRAAGVAVAEDLQHLAEIGALFRSRARTVGRRAAVITVSGAAGTVLADQLSARGMTLPPLDAATQAALRKIVPSHGMVANPVDTTGGILNGAADFAAALDAVLAAPAIETAVIYLPGPLLARALPDLARAAAATPKLLVAVDTGPPGNRGAVEAAGIPWFADMTQAARALASYAGWAVGSAAPEPPPPPPLPAEVEALLRDAGGQLVEAEGKRLLAAYGVPAVPQALVQNAELAVQAAARFGFPTVLKIASPDIAHKTEAGGVRLGLRSAAAIREAYAAILAGIATNAPAARVLGIAVQPQIGGAVELLVGATRDPVFGWLLTVGLGGVWTELMADTAHALAPIDAAGAEAMLRRLRGFPLLDGYRGAPRADLAAACRVIAAFSRAAAALGDRATEMEINPLLVRPDGALAADALIVLREPAVV